MAHDIETFMKGKNSEYFRDLHLHDLEAYYLDAYESAVRIYNDMVEKTRLSYLANVKQAKSQVIEISAAIVWVSSHYGSLWFELTISTNKTGNC